MRSRSGQWIPWVLKGLGTRELAIIPVLDSEPSASAMGAATTFLKRHTQGRALLVHQNPAVARVIHPQIRLPPWMKLASQVAGVMNRRGSICAEPRAKALSAKGFALLHDDHSVNGCFLSASIGTMLRVFSCVDSSTTGGATPA